MLDPDGLPMGVLRNADGSAANVVLALPGGEALTARIWQLSVGRVCLLLLDTDVPENSEELRGVTDRLYGGGGEHRLLQELLLGIGGARAVKTYTALAGVPAAEVFHTNEGHAGFQGLERISDMIGEGLTFAEALEAVRAATVFTTHTPVPAGIDRFDATLIERYFSTDLLPGVAVADVLALGTEDYEGGDPAVFNMAVMGLRLAQRANGVSKLHGDVSRHMFGALWPGFDADDVPIASVTNGVHAPTWTDPQVSGLAESKLGTSDTTAADWASDQVTDAELWALRGRLRQQLVTDARARTAAAWAENNPGIGDPEVVRRAARPRGADDRVRAPRSDLQAPDPDAARPGAAARPADRPGTPGAAGHRRQVASGRRRGQAPHPEARRVLAGAGCAPAHRLPAELRHRHGAAALPRHRHLAEQPAAAARGVRHVGHEGGAERVAEPVDPRRLVGGVLRRPQRLGDPVGRQRGGCRRARRPRGGLDVRPDRAPDRAAVL